MFSIAKIAEKCNTVSDPHFKCEYRDPTLFSMDPVPDPARLEKNQDSAPDATFNRNEEENIF